MILKKKLHQKIISSLLIISVLAPSLVFFSLPKKAEADLLGADIPLLTAIVANTGTIAVNTGITAGSIVPNTVTTIKSFVIEVIEQMLMAIARKLLNQMTQSTINWINTGNFGNPFFLENPQSFFKDIAKYEIKNIVDTYGYNRILYPFGKDFALNTINAYKRQASDNAAYTLSKVITDPVLLRSYQNDFNVGGWNGFLINTQYPQNNYIGFQMLATEELARRLQGTSQTAAEKTKTALEQGQGFLSPQRCTTNPNYNNMKNEFTQPKFDIAKYATENYNPPPEGTNSSLLQEYDAMYNELLRQAKAEWESTEGCPPRPDGSSGFEATTPGKVVGDQIATALTSKIKQAELASALGNSLSAIFDALLNKLFQKGLNALTNTRYTGEGEAGYNYEFETANKFLEAVNTVAEKYGNIIGSGNYGSQCADTGNIYGGNLESAEGAVLDENPTLADSLNTEANGRAFLALVETKLQSMGFNATDEVLNGNNNPSTGDIIAVWKEGDEMMERYDAISDSGAGSKTMREAVYAGFVGFIPLNCTNSGGGKDCGCRTTTGGGNPNTPGPNNPGTPKETALGLNDMCASVSSERAKFPNGTISRDNIKTIINNVAGINNASGWGLLKKTDGANCPGGVSCDILFHGPTCYIYDVLINATGSGNAGGPATSACNFAGGNIDRSKWIGVGADTRGNGPCAEVIPASSPNPNPGGGNNPVIPVTPTNIWTPTQTTNGWWPALSPDGKYVAYGNWGESWVTELTTKKTWDFRKPAGLPEGARCIAGKWKNATTLTFVCELADQSIGGFWRYEVKTGEWIPKKTEDDPNLVLGNIFVAEDNHWASYLAGTGRIARDNEVLVSNGGGGAISVSGSSLVHACTNDNLQICLFNDKTLVKKFPIKVPLHQMAMKNGYIIYGGYGPIHGITPLGVDIDLRLSSSLSEGIGQVFFVNGNPWVATAAWEPEGENTYVLLRPWGNAEAIAVKANAVNVSVAVSGTNFIIAYNSAVGKMEVITIPIN